MIKIIVLAIVFAIIILYFRSINSELTVLVTIASGIILSFFALEYLTKTIEFFSYVINIASINENFYIIIFKITGIAYLIEFSSGLLKDFGLSSLSDKLVLIGKLVVLGVSLPVFYAFFDFVSELIS